VLGLLVAAAVCHGAKLDVRARKVVDNVSLQLLTSFCSDIVRTRSPWSMQPWCKGLHAQLLLLTTTGTLWRSCTCWHHSAMIRFQQSLGSSSLPRTWRLDRE
jgi:hypothetical protein